MNISKLCKVNEALHRYQFALTGTLTDVDTFSLTMCSYVCTGDFLSREIQKTTETISENGRHTPFIELVLAEHVEKKGDVEEYRSGEPEQCDIGAVAAAVDPTNLLRIVANEFYPMKSHRTIRYFLHTLYLISARMKEETRNGKRVQSTVHTRLAIISRKPLSQ